MRWFEKRSPKDREQLAAVLRRAFGVKDAERVAPWVMPAIGFHDGKLGGEPKAIGTTRFGGRPDLPVAAPWPVGPDGPLAFLGQIALADVAALDVDRVLPVGGTLSFFYNIRGYAWGSDARDREKFAVLLHPADAKLHRRDFPEGIAGENRVTRVRAVSPYLWWQLPGADPLAKEVLGFGDVPTVAEPASDPFTERYWRLDGELTEPHVPVGTHQLLGWANGIYQQGEDCRLACELARAGFPKERSAAFAAAREDRQRWRCLLQVDDDRSLYDDTWADAGTIAFMIRDDDLKDRQFSRCWSVLSST